MGIIIQKFGGTSFRDINKQDNILSHIKRCIKKGNYPVIVVSAIGRKNEPYATDTLIEQLEKISLEIDPKKKDLIMSCGETISATLISHLLDSEDIPSEALMGIQAGIVTDDNFNSSNIIDIDTSTILNFIEQGKIPVVAGFQGATKNMEITTLGRGGSDITAVTLGGYLNADRVDIFTDVPGVAIIDPHIISSPKYIESISYDDMYNLASSGVNVIHPKAVKIGKKFNIPINIRSTYLDTPGTIISNLNQQNSDKIIGIALDMRSNPNIISVFLNEYCDDRSKQEFEDYILQHDKIFFKLIWNKNKVSILVNPDKSTYCGELIYRYFFP
ncbi:aspartate kinase [Tissierellaceae bacterium HCP3S3_D8]